MGIEVIRVDLEFFEKEKASLLASHAGKVVLIKDQKIVGIFDDFLQAYNKGIETFGVSPFLVRPIFDTPAPQQAPALTLGLLNVNI